MDLAELKKLIRLFEDSKISELELEREGSRVRLSKDSPFAPAPYPSHPPVMAGVAAHHPPAAPATVAEQAAVSANHILLSPMVGTFYRSASPATPAFVEEGDVIRKGQTLCIVEAMKLMNEIDSEVSGRIVKIFPESGKPVEYNEPLFEIAVS
jgi:acetyl-CoA carboxylase biotin carboxyl carrier protein